MITVRLRQPATDQRTADLQARGRVIAQEQADQRLEAEWRRRVRMNPKEVAALPRRIRALSA